MYVSLIQLILNRILQLKYLIERFDVRIMWIGESLMFVCLFFQKIIDLERKSYWLTNIFPSVLWFEGRGWECKGKIYIMFTWYFSSLTRSQRMPCVWPTMSCGRELRSWIPGHIRIHIKIELNVGSSRISCFFDISFSQKWSLDI